MESAFSGIVNLIDISEVSTSNAHLLLTKPPIHQPEAGLNHWSMPLPMYFY